MPDDVFRMWERAGHLEARLAPDVLSENERHQLQRGAPPALERQWEAEDAERSEGGHGSRDGSGSRASRPRSSRSHRFSRQSRRSQSPSEDDSAPSVSTRGIWRNWRFNGGRLFPRASPRSLQGGAVPPVPGYSDADNARFREMLGTIAAHANRRTRDGIDTIARDAPEAHELASLRTSSMRTARERTSTETARERTSMETARERRSSSESHGAN
ncbi:MAG: hypothetical protein Q9162_007391 [Coniocarpon cinnabarinum]